MVTLYTTHCPKCKVLTAKLNEKGIPYEEVDDVTTMISQNIMTAPYLEVDGNLMDFVNAVNCVNAQ